MPVLSWCLKELFETMTRLFKSECRLFIRGVTLVTVLSVGYCLLSCNSLKTATVSSSTSAQASQLKLTLPAAPETGVCQAYTVEAENSAGQAASLSVATSVALSLGTS